MRYVVLIDGEPGGFGVVFPDCPGCTAMGDTVQEALDNAGEALRDWMDTHVERGAAEPAARTVEQIIASGDAAEDIETGGMFASVALVRSTGRPVRANMTLDEGIVAAIDAEAAKRKVTRSAMVEILAREHLPAMA